MIIEMTPEGENEVKLSVKYTQIKLSHLSDNVLVEFLNKKNVVVATVKVGHVGPNQDIAINGIKGKLDIVKKFD